MSKVIITLVGAAGSGKSSAARHLCEKYGFEMFTFSTAIREYAEAHNLPLKNRTDFAAAHKAIVAEQGVEYLPNRALDSRAEHLIIDGLRSRRYRTVLQAAGAKTIGFDCPAEIRFARTQGIADAAKYPGDFNAFVQNEHDEEQVRIGPGLRLETSVLVETADFRLNASRPQDEVFKNLDAIVERML
ncbi:MAG TPA: AAA family ATPase [Candidatus Saccharimonadales bacterium]